jgi:hypothetical protein
MNETLQIKDIEELEAAADLFQYGIEKGYYTNREANEFNHTYWEVKNKCLAYDLSKDIKINFLDLISIITNAPNNIKDSRRDLIDYVNGRLKALKGKISGLK